MKTTTYLLIAILVIIVIALGSGGIALVQKKKNKQNIVGSHNKQIQDQVVINQDQGSADLILLELIKDIKKDMKHLKSNQTRNNTKMLKLSRAFEHYVNNNGVSQATKDKVAEILR